MTKLFIDCEFNGFGGELISMAIVDNYDNEFYQVLSPKNPIDPWVKKHVMPILNRDPVSLETFQLVLEKFLKQYGRDFTVIADWPDDIKYFCQVLITSPGFMINIPAFKTEVRRDLNSVRSQIPHNALLDAIAIRNSYNLLTEIMK